MSKAKAKAKAAPKKSASKARKATAPQAKAPQAAQPAEQAAVESKPGVTREGHITTRTHADGGVSTIHHANEDAAREYEASVPQEAV